jgi:hypothetical protein
MSESVQSGETAASADRNFTLRGLEPTARPSEHDGLWRLVFGEARLEVDPRLAGRITSLSLGQREVLTGPDVHADNWGSSFWISPQDAWGWPPPAEIDTSPYESTLRGNLLELIGPPVSTGAIAGLSITKRISASGELGVACIEYEIFNRSGRAQEVAGWEITRVPRDNLHFFPEGKPGEVKKFQDLLPLASAGQVAWLKYDADRMTRDLLVGRDGAEGWLGSVCDDLLFVKQYPEVAEGEAAPGEAEVLIFLNGESAYVELEAQSALRRLEPGQSLAWSVRWYVRQLPAELVARVGSTELVDFARSILLP